MLRSGNWSCNIDGILDGDLYVLTGTVSISNGCTINGDIWANGNVTSTSNNWHINPGIGVGNESTGSVTTNGLVDFTSNGGNCVSGSISAVGDVLLSGNDIGTVGGTVTSRNDIDANESWTTGTQTENSLTDPVFVPTLEWLRAATQWIDIDAASSWGSRHPGTCSLSSAQLITLLETAGTPLVLDYTPCPNSATLFSGQKLVINVPNITLRRDVTILSPAGKKLEVSLNGTILTDGPTRQLFLVHVDTNADHLPTCGNGNVQDQFDVAGFGRIRTSA